MNRLNPTVAMVVKVTALIFLAAATTYQCSSTTKPSEEKPSSRWRNLLVNSSFEFDGSPSDSAWYPSRIKCSGRIRDLLEFISSDAPPNGGSYSMRLPAYMPNPRGECFCAINTIAPAPAGTHCYRLSCWLKPHQAWCGIVHLQIKHNDTLLTIMNPSVSIEERLDWYYYSRIDTITSEIGDSLVVTLLGGVNNFIFASTKFDLCKLEILESE